VRAGGASVRSGSQSPLVALGHRNGRGDRWLVTGYPLHYYLEESIGGGEPSP
jgi:hypothetical protein